MNIEADISAPKSRGALIFFRVIATNQTDTLFIYVFTKDSELVEVANLPLA